MASKRARLPAAHEIPLSAPDKPHYIFQRIAQIVSGTMTSEPASVETELQSQPVAAGVMTCIFFTWGFITCLSRVSPG